MNSDLPTTPTTPRRQSWLPKHAAISGLALTLSVATATSAVAANPADHYATIVKGAQSTAPFLATVTLPGTYPGAEVSSGASMDLSTSGSSTSLLAGTPFADSYGSSTGYQYLSLSGRTVTTITFAGTMPARSLGINLGDIDAEEVVVTMAGPSGALTAEQMGFQSAYNYARKTAKPAATESGSSVALRDPSCVSGSCDTDGASAWFQVQVAVTSVTLTSTAITGFPRYQLWIAAGAGQSVTWTPSNTTANLSELPLTPNATASSSGNGAISYLVDDPGSTDCTVESTSGVIRANAGGVCVVAAVASETSSYLAGEELVAFTLIDDLPDPPEESENDRGNEDDTEAAVAAVTPVALTPGALAPTGVSLSGLAVALGVLAAGLAMVAVHRERSGSRRR